MSWWQAKDHPIWNIAQLGVVGIIAVTCAALGANDLGVGDIGSTTATGVVAWGLGRFFKGGS